MISRIVPYRSDLTKSKSKQAGRTKLQSTKAEVARKRSSKPNNSEKPQSSYNTARDTQHNQKVQAYHMAPNRKQRAQDQQSRITWKDPAKEGGSCGAASCGASSGAFGNRMEEAGEILLDLSLRSRFCWRSMQASQSKTCQRTVCTRLSPGLVSLLDVMRRWRPQSM